METVIVSVYTWVHSLSMLNKEQSGICLTSFLNGVDFRPSDQMSLWPISATVNWFRLWLVACSMASHYLNQWWPIGNLIQQNSILDKVQYFYRKCISKYRKQYKGYVVKAQATLKTKIQFQHMSKSFGPQSLGISNFTYISVPHAHKLHCMVTVNDGTMTMKMSN